MELVSPYDLYFNPHLVIFQHQVDIVLIGIMESLRIYVENN